MGYREYETLPTTPGVSPPDALGVSWLLDAAGLAWLGAHGDAKDSVVALAKAAVKARFPGAGLAPSDALAYIGAERGIVQGLTEPEASYRARLQNAFNLWQWAGTAYGVLSALYAAGATNVQVQTQSQRLYTLAGYTGNPATDLVVTTTTGINLGGTPSPLWSDFAVYILQPWPSWWGMTAPADGSTDQQSFAALVKAWKPAHARCVQFKAIKGPAVGASLVVGSFTVGSGVTVTWTPPAG